MKIRFLQLILIVVMSPFSSFGSNPLPIGNAPFVNQDGRPFQFYDLKGSYVLLSFIFTRCPQPTMCPLTMTLTKQAVRKWKKEKLPGKFHALMVTLDPDFDKPAALKKFGEANQISFSDFTFATGNPQVLSDFASNFNVIGMPNQGSISHNLKTVLLNPDLVIVKEYKDNEWKSDSIIKDMKEILTRKN